MNIYSYNQELQLASYCTVVIIAWIKVWKKYWVSSGPEIMLYLVQSYCNCRVENYDT